MKSSYQFTVRQPSKIQKAKERREKSRFGRHRAAIHGIAASPGSGIRGAVAAEREVSALRQKLARSVYLAALAIAMAGWMWMMFEGLRWVLGA